jgi:transcriptional regulator with XRE-family HTH domain
MTGLTITIGERVRHHRIRRRMLQREVGELLGVTESTVNNWERGRTTPAPSVLPRVLAFLSDAR